MKIKNQFLISIITFSIILVIIAASVILTEQQTTQLNNQEIIAGNIQTGASNVNYVSNNYFLYQDNSSIDLMQSELTTLSNLLLKLNSTNPQEQTLVNNVNTDLQHLRTVFSSVVSFLENAPRNVSVRVLPTFQTQWSRMATQTQTLAFDSQQLSQNIIAQIDNLRFTNIILIFSFLGLFATYFITNYLLTYRNTVKSISELQDGIAVLGSGNLEYSLKENKNDEVGDISRSFNKMAQNLKTVTASKADLEKEIGERKQVEQMLIKSEERWSTTLSSIGDSVIATDVSGSVTFMNAVAEKLTGWTLSEALGKPLKDVFHIINEETRLEVESPVSKVLEKGMIVGLANHSILVRKDSSEIPLDDSGAPIKNENGNVTGVVLVFHDISERKKAEEATEKQSKLINLSPDAIIVRKLDGTVTFWSEGAEKLYGWTKEEVTGKDINEMLKTELPESLNSLENRLRKEGKWSGEIVHFCKDGSKLFVQSYWLAKFDFDGKMTEIFESNVDITQRIEMQVKLEESAVRLEEYANQMEALANQRAEQLKDAERLAAIGATAGMVGHDIRNPLQAITGDLYLAKLELASTADTEEKKNTLESLDEIEKNIFYINKIVADLQDYARPLKPVAKETNLPQLIDELISKNGVPKKIKVQVKVHKDSDIVMADSDILRRILGNLVTNAVQAMPEGGKLSVQTYKEGGNSVITVADTGVGIPEEAKEKLFTPLFTTKSKGQGFGLAVVKRMTESLGGTVTFESEEGKGTKFILRLPAPKKSS
ncbi:MAG: PAS domain S-box protein, partial [Candidatus Bathyarchaeia archaeon]